MHVVLVTLDWHTAAPFFFSSWQTWSRLRRRLCYISVAPSNVSLDIMRDDVSLRLSFFALSI